MLFRFALRSRFNSTLVYVSRELPLYQTQTDGMALGKMTSELASVRTSLEPDLTPKDLENIWGFVPKGIKLVL